MTTAKKMFTLCVLAGLMLGGCQAGGWRNESHDLHRLEKGLRRHGLVTIKRPDVWTENRLHTYRREFEAAFRPTEDPPFKSFKPSISGTESSVQLERLEGGDACNGLGVAHEIVGQIQGRLSKVS